MATTKWCDWATGNDTSGDGSQGNPYKTIDKASTGLTGGDEVRVGASPASTAISANLTWTNNSTSVVATGADVSGEVAAKQFIAKASAGGPGSVETAWEIASVAYAGGNTTITLAKKYDGTTETVASVLLGVTDTGTPGSDTAIQTVSASGVSAASMLTISGGWDLGTGLRTGHTWFWQSGASNSGYGIYASSKSFVALQHIGCLRYSRTIRLDACIGWAISDCTANGGSFHNLALYGLSAGTITRVTACGGAIGVSSVTTGFHNCVITDCVANSNTTGFSIGSYNRLENCTANYNTTGFVLGGNGNIMSGCVAYNTTGISSANYANNICNNLQATGNVSADISITANQLYGEFPVLVCQRFGRVDGDHRAFCEYGSVMRDADNYNTAAPGVKFTPSSATRYIRQDYVAGPVVAATGYTLGIYLLKSATFNGDVQLEAYNDQGLLVTGPTAASVTESWVQYTLAVDSADVLDAGTLTLRVRVRGTAGTVWADDVSIAET